MIFTFDLHGVCDKEPGLFIDIIRQLKINNHVVGILTGEEITPTLTSQIKKLGLHVDLLLSIVSYHKSIGTKIEYINNDPSQPKIKDDIWDQTKAQICSIVGVNVHVDDSNIYEIYFKRTNTEYIHYSESTRELLSCICK